MWVKSGSWTGLNTDAWLFNYGVGIGSTQVPYGVRLAAGGMQVTDNKITSPNLDISGIATINKLDVNQISPDGVSFGSTSYVPIANGDGTWGWGVVTSAGAGTLSAITIKDEGTTKGNVTILDFVGAAITASVSGSTATITLDIASVQGTQGLQGLQGIQGRQGLQGLQGTQGLQGLQGTTGTQGLQGLQGTQGLQGIQGRQGLQGLQGLQGVYGPVGGSNNQVVYKDSSNNPTGSANLTFDGTNLNVSGIVTANDFNSTSDINLKTNIHQFDESLSKVIQIRGVTFDWKESNRSSAGVIAQEVEKVLPELVSGGDTKTVNYNGITGALIEAIKELKAENDIMKQRLDEVYKKVFG
jgi:hypothetical protein